MTESEERAALLPCPFCGSDDLSHSNHKPTFWHHWVQCKSCEGSMDAHGGTEKAIAKWNRRASSPPVPQHLSKLKSALYDISSGDFDATDDEVRALMCVIQEMHLVPQQGAEAVAWQERQQTSKGWTSWYDAAAPTTMGKGPGLSEVIGRIGYQWRPLYTAPPLEARSRDVKTNQEIDAMVREMKQPSDEQITRLAYKMLVHWDADTIAFARAVLALHAEPVEKMKGEGA